MITSTNLRAMSKSAYKRSERVADQLRIEVADILAKKSKDPRLQNVTVTHVDVTNDLRIAHVYVSFLGKKDDEPGILKALSSASGFVRSELGRRLELRYTPEVKFWSDSNGPRAERILDILDSLPSASSLEVVESDTTRASNPSEGS
ncbi:MAG: 30S ribosome-binding factor RbfA [Nitrospirota bacterium]|nr:30S ribosome-binding factor RbfA [Nitrospirota bacterium]